MRVFAAFLTIVLFATGLPARAADQPFDIYMLLPLTGPAAFLGRGEAQGAQAFERYANAHGGIRGRSIRIVVEDDQSNAQVAVQLLNQISAKGVAAVVGPAFTPECEAAMPLVLPSGPTMYCLSPSIQPPGGSFAFSVMPTNRDQYANMIRYLKAKGVRTLAFLSTNDSSGQDQENGAKGALNYPELRDLKLVADERMNQTDVSASAQVARIKASGAQAAVVFVSGTGFATVLRAVNDSGYEGIIATGASNAIKEQIQSYGAYLPATLIFTTLPFQMDVGVAERVRRARNVYLEAIRQVTTEQLGVPQSVPWDPLTILVDAYRKLGMQATAVQVRDYIVSLHDFAGIMGMYDFRTNDQRGLDIHSTGAMRWDKATQSFVVLSRPGGTPLEGR
jgi:branched-chain amino acid transport system substrate-binding protein